MLREEFALGVTADFAALGPLVALLFAGVQLLGDEPRQELQLAGQVVDALRRVAPRLDAEGAVEAKCSSLSNSKARNLPVTMV